MHWQEIIPQIQNLLQKSRVGLICDFDGTLAPIVPERAAAQLADGNKELLHELHQQLALVALVSGRAVYDLQERVGLPELVYVGNHGMERWVDHQVVYPPEVLQFRPSLEAILKVVQLDPDMELEDKNAILSIHYRKTSDPEAIDTMYTPILKKLAEAHGLHFSTGRMVFEIRPPVELNKGTALASLVHEHRLNGLMFIGDDATDADAMQTAHNLRAAGTCDALTIGVESPEMPEVVRHHADALATGTSDVSAFLRWLLEASKAS